MPGDIARADAVVEQNRRRHHAEVGHDPAFCDGGPRRNRAGHAKGARDPIFIKTGILGSGNTVELTKK